MAKFYLKTAIAIAAITILTTACDSFMKPLDDFVRDSTSIVSGASHIFHTPHFVRADESVAIPPNDITVITIPIENPREFDMIYKLKDTHGNTWAPGDARNGVSLEADNKLATIRIIYPERLDKFKLQLEMEIELRPMTTYELPELEARYLNNNLQSFEVNSIANQYGMTWLGSISPYPHNPAVVNYTIDVPYRTDSINVTAGIPPEIFSSFKIANVAQADKIGTQDISLSNLHFTVEVTADSTEVKNYNYAVNVVPPPVAEDFNAVIYSDAGGAHQVQTGLSTPWVITFNGQPMTVGLHPKPGKTQGTVTVHYEGIDVPLAAGERPTAIGSYLVTFEVEASGNFAPRIGDEKLTAGILQIVPQQVTFTGEFNDEFFDFTKDSANDFREGNDLFVSIPNDFIDYQFYLNGEPIGMDTIWNNWSGIGNPYETYWVNDQLYRRYRLNINISPWRTPVGEHTLTVQVTRWIGSNVAYYSKSVKFKVVW